MWMLELVLFFCWCMLGCPLPSPNITYLDAEMCYISMSDRVGSVCVIEFFSFKILLVTKLMIIDLRDKCFFRYLKLVYLT